MAFGRPIGPQQDFNCDGYERDGIKQAIEPQVFDLLVYLMENRNRVVTRDELLDNLWDGRIVSESALNGRLKMARKSVGDSGKQQRIIRIIHRRGYQFIAEVSTNPDFAQEAASPASPIPMSGSPNRNGV